MTRQASAPSCLASCASFTAASVDNAPVPAITGTRPLANLMTVSITFSRSSSDTRVFSPVDPIYIQQSLAIGTIVWILCATHWYKSVDALLDLPLDHLLQTRIVHSRAVGRERRHQGRVRSVEAQFRGHGS